MSKTESIGNLSGQNISSLNGSTIVGKTPATRRQSAAATTTTVKKGVTPRNRIKTLKTQA